MDFLKSYKQDIDAKIKESFEEQSKWISRAEFEHAKNIGSLSDSHRHSKNFLFADTESLSPRRRYSQLIIAPRMSGKTQWLAETLLAIASELEKNERIVVYTHNLPLYDYVRKRVLELAAELPNAKTLNALRNVTYCTNESSSLNYLSCDGECEYVYIFVDEGFYVYPRDIIDLLNAFPSSCDNFKFFVVGTDTTGTMASFPYTLSKLDKVQLLLFSH